MAENQIATAEVAIVAKFTPAETKLFNKLKNKYDSKAVHETAWRKTVDVRLDEELWWHWEVGKDLNTALTTAKESNQLYGKNLVGRLAFALGLKADTALRTSVRVHRAYPVRKQFEAAIAKRGSGSFRLGWAHMTHLSSIKDSRTRQSLSDSAVVECWTAAELLKKIQAHLHDRSQDTGGRPRKLPRDALACLQNITSVTKKVSSLVQDTWLRDFDLQDQIEKLPEEAKNEELEGQLNTALLATTDLWSKTKKLRSTLLGLIAGLQESEEKQNGVDDDIDDGVGPEEAQEGENANYDAAIDYDEGVHADL